MLATARHPVDMLNIMGVYRVYKSQGTVFQEGPVLQAINYLRPLEVAVFLRYPWPYQYFSRSTRPVKSQTARVIA